MKVTAAPSPALTDRRFRGDIDGLRAVAIVLVVAYHAGLSGVSGGFIGVDVFFVISGYLITTNLFTETRRSGEVDLLTFWAKRIRRLVPALALMLVVVLGLSLVVLTSLEWRAVAEEGRAAALYVSNIFYAEQATDYFAADIGDSLFLHTWSLGVEEQFYLAWPLLFGLACLVVRRRPHVLRGVLVAGFAVTLVSSFALGVWLTDRGSAWAFFSLPTRAWEFSAAGLLAAAPTPRPLRGRAASSVVGLLGLGLIGAGAVLFSSASPYPGARALLPVLGTVLVIVAGTIDDDNPVSRTLATRPTQWIGRVSYSWYLWHWPLILLAVAWLDDDRLVVTMGAAVVSLAVAVVAQRLVENPLRFAPALVRSTPRTYAVGAVATVVALLATVGVVRYADAEIDDGGSVATLEQVRESRRNFDCPRERTSEGGIDYCEAGDPDGTETVLLMGDSHTRHWAPAFIEAAEREGDQLIIRWRGACPSTNVPIASPDMVAGGDPVDADCTGYQRDTDELIDELDPDIVVLSNSATYVVVDGKDFPSADVQAAIWEEGLRDRIDSLQADGRAVAVVKDTPRLPDDPIPCLADADEPSECAVPRGEAFHPRALKLLEAEQRVVDELGDVAHLDVNDQLCPDDLCVMQIDGLYVYSDKEHLYDGFAITLAPEVIALLDEARTLTPRED